jgi:hypothetical protein
MPGGAGYSTESGGPIRQLSHELSGSLTATRGAQPVREDGARLDAVAGVESRPRDTVDQLPGDVADTRDTGRG